MRFRRRVPKLDTPCALDGTQHVRVDAVRLKFFFPDELRAMWRCPGGCAGRRNPRAEVIARLAEILDVPVGAITHRVVAA
jgi:hypothetical protein